MVHSFVKRMREIHEKDRKGQKGFTLIEPLVVITLPPHKRAWPALRPN